MCTASLIDEAPRRRVRPHAGASSLGTVIHLCVLSTRDQMYTFWQASEGDGSNRERHLGLS